MHGSQLRVMFAFSSSHAFGWAYYNQMAFAAVRLVVCCINLSTLEIRIAQTKMENCSQQGQKNEMGPRARIRHAEKNLFTLEMEGP